MSLHPRLPFSAPAQDRPYTGETMFPMILSATLMRIPHMIHPMVAGAKISDASPADASDTCAWLQGLPAPGQPSRRGTADAGAGRAEGRNMPLLCARRTSRCRPHGYRSRAFAAAETAPAARRATLIPASVSKRDDFSAYPPEIHYPYQQLVPRKLRCCTAISLRESHGFVTFVLPQRGRKKPKRAAKGLRARCGAVTGLRNRAATQRTRAEREDGASRDATLPGRQGRSGSGGFSGTGPAT